MVDNNRKVIVSKSCLVYKYILTSVVVHPGQYRLANPTAALQSSQQSAGDYILCLLTSRIGLLLRMCNACLSKGSILRHRSRSPLHILEFRSYSIFLFSLQRSSARTHGIQRTVHRCRAFSIELLQRQIALVLHYSSLLEVRDLLQNQHSSCVARSAPSLPRPMYSPSYSRMRSRIL